MILNEVINPIDSCYFVHYVNGMMFDEILPVFSDVTLKMLADDRYCGRIIGKEGKVIKKIREDTDTKITVSK